MRLRTRHARKAAAAAATACAAAVAASVLLAAPAAAEPADPPAGAAHTAFDTPDTDDCPFRRTPPPPVDASEEPLPDESAPSPLPVPSSPVGGARMGACGTVTPKGAPPLPDDVSAAGWVLADLETGQVLAAKDPHGRHRPASTIKTLFAAVTLDELNLDTVLTATAAEANIEGSRVGIGAGGQYTVHTLLRGLMMNSGNDAAQVLADEMGGTTATTSAMNALAEHLGALDTRTPTPSGLDGPGMSTSAYDLALIFRHDMQGPVFADLISHGPIEFPGYPKTQAQKEADLTTARRQLANGVEPIRLEETDPHTLDDAVDDADPDPATGLTPPLIGPDGDPVVAPDRPGFMIVNDNPLLTQYPGALGGKTGYTDDAGHTFIGAAQRDGRRLVVTLMDGTREPVAPWQQAASLLDYGFALADDAKVGTLVDPGTVGRDGAGEGSAGARSAVLAAPPGGAAEPAGNGSHGAGYYVAIATTAALVLLLTGGGVRLLRRRR